MQIQSYAQAKAEILAFLADKVCLAIGSRLILLEEAIQEYSEHDNRRRAIDALSSEELLPTTTGVEREKIGQLRTWLEPRKIGELEPIQSRARIYHRGNTPGAVLRRKT